MRRLNRIISVILTAAVIVVTVCSALFVIENSAHNCTGTDCQICVRLQSSLESFNNQTPKPETSLQVISFIWLAVLILGSVSNNFKADTLIDLKTKFSD